AASLRQAVLPLIFAYGGFENASVPTEESHEPRRHVPVALLVTIAATAGLYILIQVVVQGTVVELASSPTPLAAAGRAVLGPLGGLVVTVGAILSTVGSISALVLVGPRILFAFARHGQLPPALAAIHPLHHTPHLAVAAFALLAWAAALGGGFAQLVAISAVARLLFSASTCLAVPVLRRRHAAVEGAFVLPGGPLLPLLAAALCLWLLSGLTRGQALAGAAALAAGLLLYAWTGRRAARL
ncbi:MAG TPA: APC family permease, partial [Vicinamibacteria bacterium]